MGISGTGATVADYLERQGARRFFAGVTGMVRSTSGWPAGPMIWSGLAHAYEASEGGTGPDLLTRPFGSADHD